MKTIKTFTIVAMTTVGILFTLSILGLIIYDKIKY